MRKNLVIIPGFREKASDIQYTYLAHQAQKMGYTIFPFTPQWKYLTASEWLSEFFDFLTHKNLTHQAQNTVVFGFSFGAYISVLASQKIHFSKLILVALSPYFKEDIATLRPRVFTVLGVRRMKDFQKFSFPKINRVPASFIVGDKDHALVLKRVQKAYKAWRGPKKLFIVPNAPHDMNNKDLQLAVLEELGR